MGVYDAHALRVSFRDDFLMMLGRLIGLDEIRVFNLTINLLDTNISNYVL